MGKLSCTLFSIGGVLLLILYPFITLCSQTCEVFVDASTAAVPLEVPLSILGSPRVQEWRTVHFGQSTASICRWDVGSEV